MSSREYEIRVYDIVESKIKRLIKQNGGKLVNKKRIMPIISYEHPNKKSNTYIRIRDEGKQITMTVKSQMNKKYPIENEVEIDSIEEGNALLIGLGCKEMYRVEKIRETFIMKGAKEIVFDSYPGLPTYMEIDCHTLTGLKSVTKKLGFSVKDHDTDNIGIRYEKEYGIKRKKKVSGSLTFKNANKLFGKRIKKNKKQFNEVLKKQKKFY